MEVVGTPNDSSTLLFSCCSASDFVFNNLACFLPHQLIANTERYLLLSI